jgi:hypothetical protein
MLWRFNCRCEHTYLFSRRINDWALKLFWHLTSHGPFHISGHLWTEKVQQRSTAKVGSICPAKIFRGNAGSRAMNPIEVRLLNRIFYIQCHKWFWLQSHQRSSSADERSAAEMNGLPIQAACQSLHRWHHLTTPLRGQNLIIIVAVRPNGNDNFLFHSSNYADLNIVS